MHVAVRPGVLGLTDGVAKLPPLSGRIEEPLDRLGDAAFSVSVRTVEKHQGAIEIKRLPVAAKAPEITDREFQDLHG